MIAAADLVLLGHALYVAIVVLGVPLILIGRWRYWAWVHNPWWRGAHLLMISIVAAESLAGINCPLTVWESSLRGGAPNTRGFIATALDGVLFWHLPHWVFTAIYLAFGALVAGLFVLVPIHFGRRRAR